MASPAPRRMSLAEFLEWDDGTERRYELIEGEVFAIAAPVAAHATILVNLGSAIRNQLRSPCTVLAGAGIVRPDRADHFYVPDLVITCAPLSPADRCVGEPKVVVEILSPTSTARDRVSKLDGYRAISSVDELLLTSALERRAQIWRRDGRRWIVEDLIGEAELELESVNVSVPLAAIYESIIFEELAAGPAGIPEGKVP